MPVTLSPADRERAVQALRRYSEDALEDALGHLAAGLLLDFVLQEIGPSIYNRALEDARAHLAARLADLDLDLGLEPFPSSGWR